MSLYDYLNKIKNILLNIIQKIKYKKTQETASQNKLSLNDYVNLDDEYFKNYSEGLSTFMNIYNKLQKLSELICYSNSSYISTSNTNFIKFVIEIKKNIYDNNIKLTPNEVFTTSYDLTEYAKVNKKWETKKISQIKFTDKQITGIENFINNNDIINFEILYDRLNNIFNNQYISIPGHKCNSFDQHLNELISSWGSFKHHDDDLKIRSFTCDNYVCR
jgi:hypothetical protein